METKLPEEKKNPKTEEQLIKESLKEQVTLETPFGMPLVELVTTEAILSKQSAHMATLLGEKLEQKPPLKLTSAERALLEKAKEYYQEIANNPYPLFTPDEVKKILSKETSKNERADPLADTAKAQIINRRIEIFQWITIHIGDLQQAIDAQKQPNKFKLDVNANKEERFAIYDQKSEKTRYLNEYDVVSECLVAPIQRLVRLILLTKESLEKTSETQEKQLHTVLTSLDNKWTPTASQTNKLIGCAEDKKIGNLVKKLPADKLQYVIPLIGKDFDQKEMFAKQLKENKEKIQSFGHDKSLLKELNKTAKILKNEITSINNVLKKKTSVLGTLSTQELELFSAADPKSTSVFLKRDDVIKLTTDIRHHQKEITQLFGKEAYENVNNLAKARSAISDKAFELLINPDSQTTLTSLQPNELVKLTLDVRLHQTKITQLFSPQDYQVTKKSLKDANASIESNESYHQIDRATAKALSTISDKELALCNTSNPKFFLRNLGGIDVFNLTGEVYKQQKDLIHLTADVYAHQKEINLLFSPTILRNTRQALEKNNDPKITKAFLKLSPEEIHLFRGEERLKSTFDALKNIEDLGRLNLAVRSHRQELIFLFGKDAYQDISKAFAEEYKSRPLTAATKENEKEIKNLSPLDEKKLGELFNKHISLVNERQKISLSYEQLNKLSDKEIQLFTNPASTLKDLQIKDLVKLSKDIRSNRQEITHIFGEKAYQDMGKAFVQRYQECKQALPSENKSSRWSKYTHEEKAAAAGNLLNAIKTNATETKKILEKSSKLREIAKPLMEAEKGKQTPEESSSPSLRPGK